MKLILSSASVLALLLGCAGTGLAAGRLRIAADCRPEAGRNVQVSSLSGPSHPRMMEPVIAVNPTNPRNLVIGGWSVTSEGETVPPEMHSWNSFDGGQSWHAGLWHVAGRDRPAATFEGVDAGLGFDRGGNAIFTSTSTVSRSIDGGRNWRFITPQLGFGEVRDGLHTTQFAADLSDGPFGGHLYLFSMSDDDRDSRRARELRASGPAYDVRLLTLTGTRVRHDVTVASSASMAPLLGPDAHRADSVVIMGAQVNPPILQSGALFLLFHTFTAPLQISPRTPEPPRQFWLARSMDGGRSVSSPIELKTRDGAALIGPRASVWLATAAGQVHGADRLYVSWLEQTGPTDAWNLFFSSSSDGGATWRPRSVLEADLANPQNVMDSGSYFGGVRPTIPVMQVNRQGAILVTWYRFREGPVAAAGRPTIAYRRFMAASFDGGETFTPAQPLASAETADYRPRRRGEPPYGAAETNGDLGHFIKLTADRTGVFHAAWMDGRTGHQEIWYANIRVQCGGRPARAHLPHRPT